MATDTLHYHLKKPASADRVAVGDLNDNSDTIDGYLYQANERADQLADDYNTSSTYNTGDYVRRDNYIYKCNTDGTTGTWDDTKWDRVKITEELGNGGGGSSTFAGLNDVDVAGVANKDIARFNSSTNEWEKSSALTDLELTVSQMSASTLPYDANTSIRQKIDNVESSIPTELADLSEDSTHRTVTDTEKYTWNGKVSDNPTFSEAGTRSNIVSGESFATIFGKIKKFFSDLKTVAFTGAYSDLTGQPTIPTVNNGTLTIQKNGTNVATFTANQSGNATANITCENKISRTTTNNWSYYKDSSGVYHISGHISINSCAMTSSLGNGFYRSDVYYWNFPVTLTAVSSIIVTIHDGSGLSGATIHSYTGSRVGLWLWTLNSGTRNINVHIQIVST